MIRFIHILALLLPATLLAQVSSETWTYGGPMDEQARAIVETADGGYTLLGTTASVFGDATDFYLLHIHEDLSFGWSRPHGGIETDQGRAMAQLENGDLLLAGFSNDSPGGDYNALVFKTDNEGEVIWERSYGSADWDFCEDIALLDDDGFVLAGSTYAGNGGQDIWILRADDEGDILWQYTFGGVHDEWAEGALLTTAGTLLIAGNRSEDGTDWGIRPWVLELDLDGNLVNETAYGDTRMVLYSLREDSNSYAGVGHYFSEEEGFSKDYIVGFEYDLTQQWIRLEPNPDWSELRDLAPKEDGWITIGAGLGFGAGELAANIQDRQDGGFYLEALNSGGFEDDIPYDVLLDSQDRIVVCGESNSYSLYQDSDVYLIRLDSLDVLHWSEYEETFNAVQDISLDLEEPAGQEKPVVSVIGGELQVQASWPDITRVRLVDLCGRVVQEHTGRLPISLDASVLPHGVYILQAWSGLHYFEQKILH